MTDERFEYLQEKRLEIIGRIKPICDAHGIDNYDYIISKTGQSETLRIYDTKIGCSYNSIDAVARELIGWIFLSSWRERSLGAFDKQTRNVIKKYWIADL